MQNLTNPFHHFSDDSQTSIHFTYCMCPNPYLGSIVLKNASNEILNVKFQLVVPGDHFDCTEQKF